MNIFDLIRFGRQAKKKNKSVAKKTSSSGMVYFYRFEFRCEKGHISEYRTYAKSKIEATKELLKEHQNATQITLKEKNKSY